MKVYYHKVQGGNVGDDMNAVLWQKILPSLDCIETAHWLIGAGTILDARLNSLPGRKVVMGAGLRPGTTPAVFGADVQFAAVRGFLSAAGCGLATEVAVCDPGFLVGHLWPQTRASHTRVGFIPHIYSERYSHIALAAADADFDVISPTLALEPFLQRLAGCARIYTESLHGAIFAEALRIPWARVRICSTYYEGRGVADFKWADAFSVLGAKPTELNATGLIPIKRSWASVRRHLRPVQALAERRLINTLVARRDDDGAFQLADPSRLQERAAMLLQRTQQLQSSEHVLSLPIARQRLQQSTRDRGERPLRVLAFPKAGDNPFLLTFANSLEERGARVDDFTFQRAVLRGYDVVHMHWPDTHLRTHSWWRAIGKHARLFATCALLRARGTHIVWMIHNLKPHEKDHWISAALFPLWFPRLCTHVMALTQLGLNSARRVYPALAKKPGAVVPHGHYRQVYPTVPPRAAARRELGLPEDRFTFVFLGSIRPYKNVPLLIRTFRELSGRDIQLIVAGQPVRGMKPQDIREVAADDERIHLRLGFIPDEQIPAYLAAADQVVLPFDGILNSGSVLLALSLNRSVMAPNIGALPELQAQVGPRWLKLYEGALTPELLVQAKADPARPGENEAPDLSAFDWDVIARCTLQFYQVAANSSEASRHPSAAALGQSPRS